jgi:hypothetical protein
MPLAAFATFHNLRSGSGMPCPRAKGLLGAVLLPLAGFCAFPRSDPERRRAAHLAAPLPYQRAPRAMDVRLLDAANFQGAHDMTYPPRHAVYWPRVRIRTRDLAGV